MKKQFKYHKICNFCTSKKRKILFSYNDQNLTRCGGCNLIYFDKQRIDLDNLYNGSYYSLREDTETANYADYQTQELTVKDNFSFAYTAILRKRLKNKKLLEIGPGYGYFLKNLPATVSYEGVEVSKEAVNFIKKEKIKVKEGDFLNINLNRKYDFIVAFDVIEHQTDLKKFLIKVFDHLDSGGIFIITTPDFNSLLNRIFGKRAPTVQPLYHNYYFDQKWFVKQMPSMGFKIVSIKTKYIALLSVGQIILLGSFAIPFTKKLHLLKFARILRLENVVLPFFRFGGIECIMKKTG